MLDWHYNLTKDLICWQNLLVTYFLGHLVDRCFAYTLAADETRVPLMADRQFSDPPARSSLRPLRPPTSISEPSSPPLDLFSLSQLLGSSDRQRSLVGAVVAAALLMLVVALMMMVGVGYVLLAARLDMAASMSWLSTALVAFVAHAVIFEPLRILCIATYWTALRRQLMPWSRTGWPKK